MFKELRSTFGKLMIIYNIGRAVGCTAILILSIMHYNIAVHSIIPCYLLYFLFMQSVMVNEEFATCILAYFAYIMYHSYKNRPLTKQLDKKTLSVLHKMCSRLIASL